MRYTTQRKLSVCKRRDDDFQTRESTTRDTRRMPRGDAKSEAKSAITTNRTIPTPLRSPLRSPLGSRKVRPASVVCDVSVTLGRGLYECSMSSHASPTELPERVCDWMSSSPCETERARMTAQLASKVFGSEGSVSLRAWSRSRLEGLVTIQRLG